LVFGIEQVGGLDEFGGMEKVGGQIVYVPHEEPWSLDGLSLFYGWCSHGNLVPLLFGSRICLLGMI